MPSTIRSDGKAQLFVRDFTLTEGGHGVQPMPRDVVQGLIIQLLQPQIRADAHTVALQTGVLRQTRVGAVALDLGGSDRV